VLAPSPSTIPKTALGSTSHTRASASVPAMTMRKKKIPLVPWKMTKWMRMKRRK
jgi:hypothetical protein